MDNNTMGIDQYGRTYHNLGQHPRKALMERLGARSASKMYVDSKSGGTVHIGYVIRGHWVTVYNVVRWERKS